MAAIPPRRGSTQAREITKGRKPIPYYGNPIPGARASLLRLLLHSVRSRPLRSILSCFPGIRLRSLTAPVFLLRWSRPPSIARSLRPPDCTYHPPAAPLLLPFLRLLLGPRLHRGLLVFPLVASLEQVVYRFVSTTIVFRVAPPAVVVWSVLRPLQVHAREESSEAVRFSALAGVGSGLPFSRRTYPLLSYVPGTSGSQFRQPDSAHAAAIAFFAWRA